MARKWPIKGLSRNGLPFWEKNTILLGIWRFYRESGDYGIFLRNMIYFKDMTEKIRDIYHNRDLKIPGRGATTGTAL